eukprot:27751-Pelagococcus_subviridis.AAC.2
MHSETFRRGLYSVTVCMCETLAVGVAFARASHSPARDDYGASLAAIMAKKGQKGPGKPFLEWCAENGERGERLAN